MNTQRSTLKAYPCVNPQLRLGPAFKRSLPLSLKLSSNWTSRGLAVIRKDLKKTRDCINVCKTLTADLFQEHIVEYVIQYYCVKNGATCSGGYQIVKGSRVKPGSSKWNSMAVPSGVKKPTSIWRW